MIMRINEIFSSINGECNSFHQGSLCTFVRTQGCSERCFFCDTKYAQDPNQGTEMLVSKVFEEIEAIGNRNVTITGGEPLLQLEKVNELCAFLRNNRYNISIETNGFIQVPTYLQNKASIVMDYKLASAGLDKRPNWDFFRVLKNSDFIKFVCSHWFDFQEAVSFPGAQTFQFR